MEYYILTYSVLDTKCVSASVYWCLEPNWRMRIWEGHKMPTNSRSSKNKLKKNFSSVLLNHKKYL